MSDKDKSRQILLRCHSCGALNTVPKGKLSAHPKCGKCHTPIHIMTAPINVTTAAFDKVMSTWPEYMLLEFWSRTCGHCQRVEPAINALAYRHPGILLVAKVDIDDEPALASRYNVSATPKFIIQKKGTQLAIMDGAPERNSQLIEWVEEFLG